MPGALLRRLHYDDLLGLPENVVGEIVDGTLVSSPRPAVAYAWAAKVLGYTLKPLFSPADRPPDAWWVLSDPKLRLGSDILAPDLAGWRQQRAAESPGEAVIPMAPDWVCEVVSPSTACLDRGQKRAIYAREGVPFLWLVYPLEQALEAFRLEAGHWVLTGKYADDAVAHIQPFDTVGVELGRIWAQTTF